MKVEKVRFRKLLFFAVIILALPSTLYCRPKKCSFTRSITLVVSVVVILWILETYYRKIKLIK